MTTGYLVQPLSRIAVLALAAALLASCSIATPRHEPLESLALTERAKEQVQGPVRVRAAVPAADEAKRLFGIPLYDAGIQPVWLEVANQGDQRMRLTLTSIDPKYFPPFEVAYMHRKRFSKEGWQELEAWLHENALPRQIGPGETVSGFVFTNLHRGTKAFNVDIFDTGGDIAYRTFSFFLEVPGFVPDHASVDFSALYPPDAIADVDTDGLRDLLDTVPCCTVDRSGERQGRPANVFIVAEGKALLRALLRAGWSETAYQRDEDYLDAAEYFYGRVPDAIFRKGRDRTTERLELTLWVAPVRVSGKPLWVGQVRHAIGRFFELGERFFGVNLDPDVTEGRNYLLQDLWYSQSLEHWAWSDSGIEVPRAAPVNDFAGKPWFTVDPYRVVLWVSERPVAMSRGTRIDWHRMGMDEEATP